MLRDERQVGSSRAQQVLALLRAGGYDDPTGTWVSIADEQARAEAGTVLYTPDMLESLRARGAPTGAPARISIEDATTQQSARAWAAHGSVAILNFASARNPGGGFLGGARAQEEDLCRCSGLYPTLLTQPDYYHQNRSHRSALYTDHIIFSPDVPFFRADAKEAPSARPFFASVITAPAPNTGALIQNEPSRLPELRETFDRRWANVFAASEDRGQRVLILGAWGCGAFRGDPRLVAESARAVLTSERFLRAFTEVVFAIPNAGNRGGANFDCFSAVFGGA
jgi:uncharacterized protein (TIGR02452 family)